MFCHPALVGGVCSLSQSMFSNLAVPVGGWARADKNIWQSVPKIFSIHTWRRVGYGLSPPPPRPLPPPSPRGSRTTSSCSSPGDPPRWRCCYGEQLCTGLCRDDPGKTQTVKLKVPIFYQYLDQGYSQAPGPVQSPVEIKVITKVKTQIKLLIQKQGPEVTLKSNVSSTHCRPPLNFFRLELWTFLQSISFIWLDMV